MMHLTEDGVKRVMRTFFQAALAYITVNLALIDFSEEKATVKAAVTGLAVSAVAAGLAAVMNLERREDYTNE